MSAAVIEWSDGSKQHIRHNAGVRSVKVGYENRQPRVKLEFGDGTEQKYFGAISGLLVDDFWYVRNQLGVAI